MIVSEILKDKMAPITIRANMLIQDAMRLLIDNNISSLVVIDKDKNPVGIITEHDIFHLAFRYRGDMMDMEVGENMSSDLIVSHPEDSIEKIITVMLEKHIRHMPVTDDGNKLTGILSMRDLISII